MLQIGTVPDMGPEGLEVTTVSLRIPEIKNLEKP